MPSTSSSKRKANHKSDQRNRNKKTSGVNKVNSQAEGNRGKQLNPTYIKDK